ncbi:MAG: AAA family ATPase [Spirochaetes bacterium]|nr:AAA family ATPase [Spirochaetota bacterium]
MDRDKIDRTFRKIFKKEYKDILQPVNRSLSGISENYNGYRFTRKNTRVYNPFSILNCFDRLGF